MTVQCWWIRHAPIPASGCYTGHRDVAAILPPAAVPCLIVPSEAIWFTSSLARAMDTAQWLMQAMGHDTQNLQPIDALREQHFGAWEGRFYDEVWQNAKDHDWSEPALLRPEGGESFADVCDRVDAWLERLLELHMDAAFIMVGHAGTIRAALRHALGLSPTKALGFQLDYGSVTHITYGQSAIVEYVNRLAWQESA